MKFELVSVKDDEIDLLINYKLATIITDEIDEEEKIKIINYVKNNSLKRIESSKFIVVNNKVIGCVVLYSYLDGVLLDELYLEREYRKKGIGSVILKDVLSSNNIVYLFVYKNNDIALTIYKKLGFMVSEETDTRYFMKYLQDSINK